MQVGLITDDAKLVERFKSLNTPRDVADLLEVPYSTLIYYLYRKRMDSNYTVFHLKKKSGGIRTITAPVSSIKILQKKLNYILRLIYTPKKCVHGFVENRSILTNAQTHIRRGTVLNIDLSDFFPSINFGRVRGMFMAKPYNIKEKPATVLAHLCCFNGHLAQGAPTSPIVSNMVCGKLDSELLHLARRYRCSYTRYADDITFSTTRDELPTHIAKMTYEEETIMANVGDTLRATIENNGFLINPNKVRIQSRRKRQEVTGLIVNKLPNVKRNYVRQIRAMIHAIDKYGLTNADIEFRNSYYKKQIGPGRDKPPMDAVLLGKLNYLRMVKGETNQVYRKLYNSYLESMGKPRKYITDPIMDVGSALWVLESREATNQGTAFMLKGFGLVTCQHVLQKGLEAFLYSDINKKYPAEILAQNKDLDIAILKPPDVNCPTLEAGNPEDVKQGDKIILAGFPNYRDYDSPYISEGKVAGFRTMTSQKWLMINTPIIAGNSGGPVLNDKGEVIGIAATGADRMENAGSTEHHGVIPITAINHLKEK